MHARMDHEENGIQDVSIPSCCFLVTVPGKALALGGWLVVKEDALFTK